MTEGSTTVIETLKKVADNPDYYKALDYVLTVETRCMNPDAGTRDRTYTFRFPLGEGGATVAYDGRVIEVMRAHPTADDRILFLEADHRGPEHGVDGWVGLGTSTPDFVVEAISASGVTDD